jgi:DNA modification methylase
VGERMEPYYQNENGVLYCGDALDVLKQLPDCSVNTCVTSPPYWGLRDYGVAGQIGLEETPDEYVRRMVEVFREVWRALRDDGTLWLNLGDSYASGKGTCYNPGGNTSSFNVHLKAANVHPLDRGNKSTLAAQGLKPKDLIGIPWRVAFALQADGWYLRQDIIWSKPNPMPESVRDRCTKSHEYIFLLSKSSRYFYDAEAIKEPCKDSSIARLSQDIENQDGSDRVPGKTNGPMKAVSRRNTGVGFGHGTDKEKRGRDRQRYPEAIRNDETKGTPLYCVAPNATTRNKRSVWTVTTQPFAEAHFATFPPALIEPCILAGCSKGGTVLDPFFGSGTTGLVCQKNGRKWTGIDLSEEYCKLAIRRVNGEMGQIPGQLTFERGAP